jgi:DNA-binding XRE family transcriptional regulator
MKRSLSAPRYRPCRNPCPNSLGVRLRLARYALGMTQQQLAALFRVTRETINRIECGRRGDYSTKYGVCLLRERMRIWAEMNKPAGREAIVANAVAGGCFF